MADNVVQVSFGGSTSDLDDAVDHVKDKVNEVQGPVDALSSKLAGLGESLAAAFTVDKVIEFTEQTTEAALQLERLEAATALSGNNIQTLQFAMKATGGSAEAAGMMMTRFERAVSEAASGTGPAYEAFQKLHISLGSLEHDNPDQLFHKTIAGFAGITDPAERAAVGIQVFSRGYLQMAAVLPKGEEGFAEFNAKLLETGDYMNDARTGEFAKLHESIEEMGHAWHALGEQIELGGVKTLEAFMNFLQSTAQTLRAFVVELELAAEGFKLFAHLQDEMTTKANVGAILNTPDAAEAGGENDTNRGAEERAKKQSEIDQQTLEDKARLYAEDFANFKANEDLKVAQGTVTAEAAIADERRGVEATRDLILTNLDQEMRLNESDAKEFQKLQDEKLIIAEKFQTELTQLQVKEVEAQKEALKKQEKC